MSGYQRPESSLPSFDQQSDGDDNLTDYPGPSAAPDPTVLRPGANSNAYMGFQGPQDGLEFAPLDHVSNNMGMGHTFTQYYSPNYSLPHVSPRTPQADLFGNSLQLDQWYPTLGQEPLQNVDTPNYFGGVPYGNGSGSQGLEVPWYNTVPNTNMGLGGIGALDETPIAALENPTRASNVFSNHYVGDNYHRQEHAAFPLTDAVHGFAVGALDPWPTYVEHGGPHGNFYQEGVAPANQQHYEFHEPLAGTEYGQNVPAHELNTPPPANQQVEAGRATSLPGNNVTQAETRTLPEADGEYSNAQPPRAKKRATRKAPAATKATPAPASTPAGTEKKKKWVRRQHSKYPEIMAVMARLQEAAQKLTEWENSKPAVQPLLPAPNGLYFSSILGANAYNNITYWDPPVNDSTIPTTQAARENLVIELLSDIKNNKNCLKTNEQKDSQSFQNRWADGANFYAAPALEAVAWRLSELAIDVHQQGWVEPLSEPKLRDDIYYSMSFTFAERITLIRAVLQVSKSTCEDLIKGNRLQEVVGCPHTVFERIYGNNKSNRDKRATLSEHKAGKDQNAPKRKRDDEDAGSDVDPKPAEATETQSQPARPRKKQRKTATKPARTSDDHEADSDEAAGEPDVDTPSETTDDSSVAPPKTRAKKSLAESAVAPKPVSKAKRGKRAIQDVEDGVEPPASPGKRHKAGSNVKAPTRRKAKAKARSATAVNTNNRSDDAAGTAAPEP